MLRIFGTPKRLCDGLTRRDVLQVGGLALFGVGVSDLFSWQQGQAASVALGRTFGRAKACILLYAYGSPAQQETFDPKPDAPDEIRGEWKAISSSLSGVQVGELLPQVAKVMDRITVVRSMTHPYPLHCTAYVVSGIPTYRVELESQPRDSRHWPYLGCIVDYLAERKARGHQPRMPRNIALPWKMNVHSGGPVFAGPYAAFLGTAYDPVLTDFEGEPTRTVRKIVIARNGTPYQVRDPYAGIRPNCRFSLAGGQLPKDVVLGRFQQRQALLQRLDRLRSQMDAQAAITDYDRIQQRAFSLVASSKVREALDIDREPMKLREGYGMNLFGQSCLAARRLVEAGSKFITVFWDEFGAKPASDWDTHYDHFYRMKEWLLPGFDQAFSRLILDLEERGRLDEALVIWMSEHGRAPRVNKNWGGGRDHWSRAYTIALAGGGIGKGQVVGRTDRIGADVVEKPISPKDILATVFHLLGIDPNTTVPDRFGRPMRIAGDGEVRPELF